MLQRTQIEAECWRRTLMAPVFGGLSADEQSRLYDLARIFMHEKSFSGAAGFSMDETTRVHIAAQAALLVLNLDIDRYRGWQEIIVYPDAFVPQREYTDESGIVHVTRYPLLGEAWARGPVIFSAADVGSSMLLDGANVVIHEMAHKLDMYDGHANGLPDLHRDMRVKDWADAFTAAYDNFRFRVAYEREPVINPYAATAPAEFFAVLSEVFFETPTILLDVYPQVYAQLKAFYRQDPYRRLPAQDVRLVHHLPT